MFGDLKYALIIEVYCFLIIFASKTEKFLIILLVFDLFR